MPRINPIDLNQADAATAETLGTVKAQLGSVPNLFTTFAQSPAVLNAYLQFSERLAEGRLSAQQREIVALAVAHANQCQYCLSAHTLLGKGAGLSEADIQQARRGGASNPRDAAIARFARQVAENRGRISDEALAEVRVADVDDGLIIEIIGNVALNTLTNYTNHIAETVVDFPVVDLQAA